MITADHYEKLLGSLEKDNFEAEVCARLAAIFADFQRVPRKPKGDGGLDGISHGQTRGYCCYGPEQEPFKMNTKGLKADILKKFRGDLLKLFELEHDGRTNFAAKPSPEMKTVIGSGKKLTNIYLVVSVFETHQLIGAVNDSFDEFRRHSSCTYIDSVARPTIWGPRDLASMGAVDEHLLFRLEQRALVAKVNHAVASGAKPTILGDFDGKFDYLKNLSAARAASVDRLREHFRSMWGAAIALDQELLATSLTLHEALQDARTHSTVSADIASMSATDPMLLLMNMQTKVAEHLKVAFGERLGPLSPRIADGEVARLVGECPIEWRNRDSR